MANKNGGGDMPVKLKIRLSSRSGESGSGQVAGQVREMISSGRLKAGDVLPSEDGLAEQMGVGRKIVRYAYDKLVEEGLLVRNLRRNKRVAAQGVRSGKKKGAVAKKGARKK